MACEGECCKHSKRVQWSELPVDIWMYIVQLVAIASLQSTLELQCVSKSFKELADDWSTFAVIDMDGFGGGYRHSSCAKMERQVCLFTNRCWEARNPKSLFRKGIQVPLALGYFDVACKPGTLYWPVYSLVEGQYVAFYAACMMRLILGTPDEEVQVLQQLCGVLDWSKSGWDIIYYREELERAMKETNGSRKYLISNFPSSFAFLPHSACLVCGESIYWHPFGRNMWYVYGDKSSPKDRCGRCKYLVEAVYFYQILMYGIPKWPTPFPTCYYEVFRNAYFGRERVVKQFHLLDPKLEF